MFSKLIAGAFVCCLAAQTQVPVRPKLNKPPFVNQERRTVIDDDRIPVKYRRILEQELSQQAARDAKLRSAQHLLDEDTALLQRMEKNSIINARAGAKLVIPDDPKKTIQFQSASQKRKHIEAVRANIDSGTRLVANLKRPTQVTYGDISEIAAVGNIGHLRGQVLQVLGKDSMLITRKDGKGQIDFFMVKKRSTANVADNQQVDVGLVELTGTTTYRTVAGGNKTVLVAEPFDVAELDRYRKMLAEPKAGKSP